MLLLKFKQNNCTPCKMAETFIENELKVDVDEVHNLSLGEERTMELASKFGVMTTPALVLVDDDYNEIETVVGVGQNKIRKIFEKRGLI